jgi:two-component system, OmpR family, phosphate regulon response regulator PhoB
MDQQRARVLVVDDDEQLAELLRFVLAGEGYEVVVALDAASAIANAHEENLDLVVLDVGLGNDDGRMVLAEIRKLRDLPVIFMSGQGDPAERILGLRLGADDYLVKPFAPLELAARVASVLRRAQRSNTEAPEAAPPIDGVVVDERTRDVFVDRRPVELTAKEFDLLAFFVRSPRQVFSRGQLLEHVWASRPGWQDEATVTEHVRRLRYKIEKDPENPRWLTTVRGVGYRFEP